MGKKRRILLAAVVLVVAGGVAWHSLQGPPEPVYEGHTVSYWLKHPKRASINLNGRWGVSETWPTMDSNAVPFLVKFMETKESKLHLAYTEAWPKMPRWLRNLVPEPVSVFEVRRSAILLLYELGCDAKPAIPALVRVMKGDDNIEFRRDVAITLGRVGKGDKRAAAALVETLNDSDPEVRALARASLKQIDPEAAAKAGVK